MRPRTRAAGRREPPRAPPTLSMLFFSRSSASTRCLLSRSCSFNACCAFCSSGWSGSSPAIATASSSMIAAADSQRAPGRSRLDRETARGKHAAIRDAAPLVRRRPSVALRPRFWRLGAPVGRPGAQESRVNRGPPALRAGAQASAGREERPALPGGHAGPRGGRQRPRARRAKPSPARPPPTPTAPAGLALVVSSSHVGRQPVHAGQRHRRQGRRGAAPQRDCGARQGAEGAVRQGALPAAAREPAQLAPARMARRHRSGRRAQARSWRPPARPAMA